MKILVKVFLICYLLWSSLAFAKQPVPEFLLFHINGVNTSSAEAAENLKRLREVSKLNFKFLKWDLLYNSTHGLLASDLWDTFRMKKQEGQPVSLDDYVQTYIKSKQLAITPNSQEYEDLKSKIKRKYIKDPSISGVNLKSIVNQFHDQVPLPYHAFVSLLREYQSAKKPLPYILLIPHSQGNQYANQLWHYVTKVENFPEKNITTFGIAAPTNFLWKLPNSYSMGYVTAINDYVINSFRTLLSLVPNSKRLMPGNVRVKCGDLLCHSLIESYLSTPMSREQIKIGIKENMSDLYKNAMEWLKDHHEVNYDFRMYVRDHGYKLVRENGGVICDRERCINQVFKYPRDFAKALGDEAEIYGFLTPGNYINLSKSPNAESSSFSGYITYAIGYAYFIHHVEKNGRDVEECYLSASADDNPTTEDPWWKLGHFTAMRHCARLGFPLGFPPEGRYLDNNIILAKFGVW